MLRFWAVSRLESTWPLIAAMTSLIVGGGNARREAWADAPTVHRFTEDHMGTRFTLSLYAENPQSANQAAAAAFERIGELERVFSTYDPQSEARRLCDTAELAEWTDISRDLWIVLRFGRKVSEQTGGAFDLTVGPVTRLWRQARRARRLPNPDKLKQARQAVGYRNYDVDPQRPRVRLLKPQMRFDFGGIAKGYALDEAKRVLQQHGIKRCSVNGGGDLIVGEAPPGKATWTAHVRAGLVGTDLVPVALPANHALATSGDLYQHLEIDGKRYSHLIDPRTGWAVTGSREVSVIAKTGMEADAWASALCVLPVTQIEPLLRQRRDLGVRYRAQGDDRKQPTHLRLGGLADLFPTPHTVNGPTAGASRSASPPPCPANSKHH